MIISNLSVVNAYAEDGSYKNVVTKTEKGVTLKIEWNDPTLGQETSFHLSASGGTGSYKFYMESPLYYNPGESYYEVIQDPSRTGGYTSVCESYDYKFTLTASGTYGFNFAVMDTGTSPVTIVNNNIKVTTSDSSYPSVNAIVNIAVAQCNAETDGSDYARALWLHDWLIDQMEYDYSFLWASAESALTRHKGTCQSYKDAYQLLLNTAGIENSEIRDYADTHTWNAVKLDGEWYQIDCTNDDSANKYYYSDQRHLYFGLTDELMAVAHSGHTNIYTASGYSTRSTSLKNNYYVRSGEAATWANTYKDRVQAKIDSEAESFIIDADNVSDQTMPTISGIYNGIIAYVLSNTNWTTTSGKVVNLEVTGNTTQLSFNATYYGLNHEHTWNDGEITTKATCTTEGVKTFTCTDCKQTKTETINKIGHNFSSEWTIDVQPTCVTEGSRSHHCLNCNEKIDIEALDATGVHNYEWKIESNATCVSEGTRTQYCINCNAVGETETIPATGNHTWDDGVILTQPTCTNTGTKKYTCTSCNQTKTDVINALGHSYEWKIIKNATCTTNGTKNYTCTRCGNVMQTQNISNTGHHWNNGIITKQPSNTSTGIKTYTCTTCGTTRTEQIARTQSGYRNQWAYINNGWYYFDESGNMVSNRWQGNYYLVSDGRMATNQWIGNYYVGSNGAYVPNGWRSNSTGWWYRYGDGSYPVNKFETINGAIYYFNGAGYMVTGWKYINNSWYYFNGSGAMVANRWQGNYYLGNDGRMATNQWIGNWYVGSDGAWVQSGWKSNSVGWWYQYVTGGYPANKFETINGATYCFNGSGYMVTGWKYINNAWYYFNGSGAMSVNRWQGNYYLGSDGRMVTNQWIGSWFVGNDGAWIPNYG